MTIDMGFVSKLLRVACLTAILSSPVGAGVFINEIDYDNDGLDTFEWIELAGSAGTTLDDYEILLIDHLGIVYNTLDLAAAQFTFPDDTGTGWGFFVLGNVSPEIGDAADHVPNPWDRNQIQNGSRDSIQLRLKSGAVNVHLVDYEGNNESTAEDEVTTLADSNDQINRTLYKTGKGAVYEDFVFANDLGNATPGALNEGQILLPSVSTVPDGAPGPAFDPDPGATLSLVNGPNPFAEETIFSFHLAGSSTVAVAVYDASGRHVRSWPDMRMSAGRHRLNWDGRDDAGHRLASGTYLYVLLLNGKFAAGGRAVLLR